MMSKGLYEETSRYLDTPEGRLHYHEAGEGDPLILLHGSGPGVSGWANFEGNLPLFARHFRCLVLDMPGFGDSEAPATGHPMLDAPAAVLRFCNALKIDRAHFIGNSMGGAVTTSVALQRPDLVRRFISIGGIGVNIFSSMPSEGIKLLVDFTEAPSRDALVRWLQSMVYDQSLITEELIADRLQRATEPKTLEWARRMYSRAAVSMITKNLSGANGSPSWAQLAKIACPTLLAWGRDDRVSPIDMALLPMRLIPRCELHTFYDCGHWAMIERKAEFESVALSFLLRP